MGRKSREKKERKIQAQNEGGKARALKKGNRKLFMGVLVALLAMSAALAAFYYIPGLRKDEEIAQEQNDPAAEEANGNIEDAKEGNNEGTAPESEDNPLATIEMADGGIIEVELYPDIAPNTVNNFISLANKGFYDGLIFHRVVPGFMIQGGCPQGTGVGGPGYNIKGEFTANNFTNDLKHERGVISMARSQPYDSAGSQFFIMVENSPHLDNAYAGFGRVVSGMDVADRIVNAETAQVNPERPVTDQVIKRITVDTRGREYSEPEKVS